VDMEEVGEVAMAGVDIGEVAMVAKSIYDILIAKIYRF